MANKFNYRAGPVLQRSVPVASGTVIEIGDLLRMSSGKAMTMRSAGDNLAFIGIAAARHSSIEASGTVEMFIPLPNTIFEYDLDASTALVFGGQLQTNGRQTLKVSTTDAIASVMESRLSATTALCVFKLPQHTNGLKLVGDAS